MINTKYDYISLLKNFINGDMPAMEFVIAYIDNLKTEWDELDEKTYEILEYMFFETNDYTDDKDLLNTHSTQYITEDRLRKSAKKTLQELQSL